MARYEISCGCLGCDIIDTEKEEVVEEDLDERKANKLVKLMNENDEKEKAKAKAESEGIVLDMPIRKKSKEYA